MALTDAERDELAALELKAFREQATSEDRRRIHELRTMNGAAQKVLDLQQSRRDMLAALKNIEGGHFPDASNMVLAGDWHGAFIAIQKIARDAIASEALTNDGSES